MKNFDYLLIMRYIILTTFIILILFLISMVQDDVTLTFDFKQLNLAYFIGFTLIGCAIHIVDDNILKKDAWGIELKLETLVVVIIYFFIAISIYVPINFLIRLYLKTNISVSLLIMPFQILFGYTLIKLFFKKG